MEVWCRGIAIWRLHTADRNTHVRGDLCCSEHSLSRVLSWPTFNPSKATASGQRERKKVKECPIGKKKQKRGPLWEGRQSGEGWHRQRAKALADACHPPLRILWLAFVVRETANSCMQMALFPRGWPPLFWASVWQGRFLHSIKEGVAFSQIRVPPQRSQQEYFRIVCLFILFHSPYYW